jgi:hypothetical protein
MPLLIPLSNILEVARNTLRTFMSSEGGQGLLEMPYVEISTSIYLHLYLYLHLHLYIYTSTHTTHCIHKYIYMYKPP